MNKEIRTALLWAGGIIAVALGATILRQWGYISQDTVIRTVAMNGLMVVYYGNQMPKKAAPNICAHQIARFAGWSFVITGLIYAGFWAFAPLDLAMTIGTGALALGVGATAIYTWSKIRAAKAAGNV